jgi:tetratricopeptide (TPR) repeat protein
MTAPDGLAIAQKHLQQGHLAEAERYCLQVVQQSPQDVRALNLLATIFERQGKWAEAGGCYQRVIALQPQHPDSYNLLGNALQHLKRFAEAVPCYQKAIALQPQTVRFHNNLGAALQELGQYQESIACYHRAIALQPNYPDAHYNLGNTLRSQGDLVGAVAAYQKAVELHPNFPAAYNNAGLALYDLCQPEAAIEQYEQAIALDPDFADAHQNLGLALLLAGRLSEGFQEYEWRWRAQGPDNRPLRDCPQPLWDGSNPQGKTILLHAEQGYGDTLQFVRYAPLIAAQGGRVLVECQPPLVRLLKTVPGVDQVIPAGEPIPPFDVHAPLMSLPDLCGTTLESVPASVPYLNCPDDRKMLSLPELDAGSSTDQAMASHGSPLKVGLVWSGNSTHRNDRHRSCPFSHFIPLIQQPNMRCYSLQKGNRAADAIPLIRRGMLVDWGDRLHDFADTAAAIDHLDLVITIDTSVAHLAGAMGKPVWVFLSFAPDWRWMLHCDRSPWYPSMRLFRQSLPGDWAGVVSGAIAALQERLV